LQDVIGQIIADERVAIAPDASRHQGVSEDRIRRCEKVVVTTTLFRNILQFIAEIVTENVIPHAIDVIEKVKVIFKIFVLHILVVEK
jgi:hypothetical protein